MKDTLFLDPGRRKQHFEFDEAVAEVFDDMLQRSVPFYFEVQNMIADIVGRFLTDQGRVYDLGCSVGTTLMLLDKHLQGKPKDLIGLDNSPAMLLKAEENLKVAGVKDYTLIEADLNVALELEKADVVILNLVLQFVRPENRRALVGCIHSSLEEKGCLILVEKVVCDDKALNQHYIDWYHEFKKRNLYTDKEITRKRKELENILVPYTIEENIALLKEQGFVVVECFFRWFNFCGLIAFKSGSAL